MGESKNMKRTVSLWVRRTGFALLLTMPLGLMACGGDKEPKDDPSTANALLNDLDANQNASGGKFIEGLSIAGVNVGNMTRQEAQPLLSQPFAQLASGMQVNILVDGQTRSYSASQLGIAVDENRTLDEAANLGNGNEALVEQAKSGGYAAPVYFAVNPSQMNASLVALEGEFNMEATEPQVEFDPGSSERFHFLPGQDGKMVDTIGLAASIEQAVGAMQPGQPITVQANVTTTPPSQSVQDLQQNISKIVTFSTKYTGSSDRTANLILGAEKINGKVVKPGHNFSFNEVVGERTEKNGWKQAATIVGGNRYENDFGGGICQVSTTLYNAVLKADLKIVERNKHSIPSNYIETGLDATVDYPSKKDLVFQNNTDYPIYIFSNVNKSEERIYVSIYGRPLPSGETIILRSRETGSTEPDAPEIIEDETMSPGKTAWEITRRNGVTVEVYKEYKANGEVVREEVMYKDTYRAERGVQRVGVGSGGGGSSSGGSSSHSDDIVDFGSESGGSDLDIPTENHDSGDDGLDGLASEGDGGFDLPEEG